MHPNAWPHERVERLTTLWSSTLGAGEIAQTLMTEFPVYRPISGDAVTKKAKAEGLPPRARTETKATCKRPIAHQGGGFSTLRGNEPRPPTTFKEDVFPVDTRKEFLDLKPGDCRWPGASGFFCGLPAVPDQPYCCKHCARSYVNWRGLDDRAA